MGNSFEARHAAVRRGTKQILNPRCFWRIEYAVGALLAEQRARVEVEVGGWLGRVSKPQLVAWQSRQSLAAILPRGSDFSTLFDNAVGIRGFVALNG
jgi:hypothetical protein